MDDIRKKGKVPEYLQVFIPWTYDEDYAFPVTPEQRKHILATLTDEEKWLLRFVNPDGSPTTIENIAWRRWKIGEVIAPLGFTKEDFFKQWFPMTPEEAFVFSGKSIFGISDLLSAQLECYPPEAVGTFNYYGKFIEHKEGIMQVWQTPKLGEKYVIGADVAEGISGDKHDYSSADVIRCSNGQQVCHVNCKLDPDQWGAFLNHLGRYYNDALIGCEANNHGLTTITTLKHKCYPKVYQREKLDAQGTGRKQKQAGWLTTTKSKFKIIDGLVTIVRDRDTGIVCYETIEEFKNYSILEDGSYGAMPGKHDDRVMSYAIAHEMYMTMPLMRLGQSKRQQAEHGTQLNLQEAEVIIT
jgi:hypothetical protein